MTAADRTGRIAGAPDPRGDRSGLVALLVERTLALSVRTGNRRLDSLRNLLLDPGVCLLSLVPDRSETATLGRMLEDQLGLAESAGQLDAGAEQANRGLA